MNESVDHLTEEDSESLQLIAQTTSAQTSAPAIDVKCCSKCQQIKPITEFRTHPNMKDGHLNTCKACTNARQRERFATDEEYRSRRMAQIRASIERYHARLKVDPDLQEHERALQRARYARRKAAKHHDHEAAAEAAAVAASLKEVK